jgi:hypothetical protein
MKEICDWINLALKAVVGFEVELYVILIMIILVMFLPNRKEG